MSVTKHYVYILQSLSHPEQYYTGLCSDMSGRLAAHNAGQSPHTAKHKPWKLVSCHWFETETTAVAFERYFKSGSGRAFALKRLR